MLQDVWKMMELERELRKDYNRLRQKMNTLKALKKNKERLTLDLKWFHERADFCASTLQSIDQQFETEIE